MREEQIKLLEAALEQLEARADKLRVAFYRVDTQCRALRDRIEELLESVDGSADIDKLTFQPVQSLLDALSGTGKVLDPGKDGDEGGFCGCGSGEAVLGGADLCVGVAGRHGETLPDAAESVNSEGGES